MGHAQLIDDGGALRAGFEGSTPTRATIPAQLPLRSLDPLFPDVLGRHTRGSSGVFQDASGQPLSLQLRTTEQNTIQARAIFPTADYWKQIGVEVETLIVPNQLIPDREYRSTFPSFELVSSGHSIKSSAVRQYHSSSTPLPTTRFQGANRARYQNPELDSIIDRYVITIPMGQRLALLGDLLNLQTTQLTMLPLFFQANATILGSARLQNVTNGKGWNAYLWELD